MFFAEPLAPNGLPRGSMTGFTNSPAFPYSYNKPADGPALFNQEKHRLDESARSHGSSHPNDSYINGFTTGFANGFSSGFTSGFSSGLSSAPLNNSSTTGRIESEQRHSCYSPSTDHVSGYEMPYQEGKAFNRGHQHRPSLVMNAPANDYMNGHSKERGGVNSLANDPAIVDINEVAISPNDPGAVSALLDQIVSLGRSMSLDDNKARIQLRDTARSLANALETPREAILRYCWSQATSHATIEIAINLGVFSILALDDKPKSVSELAYATNSEARLLSRIMKHLAAIEVISETGPDEYRGTNLSNTLSVERYSDAFPLVSRWFYPAIFALPSFLEKSDYNNPTDMSKAAFQLGQNSEDHFFEFAKRDASLATQFNNHMSVYRQGRPSWMDKGIYPVRERLLVGANQDNQSVFMVDIGGSTGHDISEFQRKCPEVPGRLILQDLPEVVNAAKGLHSSIEKMAHDFFTEQPVKGARVYYLHSVLHDWPDDVCRTIFANLIPAMKRGYSKILINENVVPSTGAHWETTSLDLIMMSMASVERSETHWRQLIQSAGLRIVKIWTAGKGVESLIECELA